MHNPAKILQKPIAIQIFHQIVMLFLNLLVIASSLHKKEPIDTNSVCIFNQDERYIYYIIFYNFFPSGYPSFSLKFRPFCGIIIFALSYLIH